MIARSLFYRLISESCVRDLTCGSWLNRERSDYCPRRDGYCNEEMYRQVKGTHEISERKPLFCCVRTEEER